MPISTERWSFTGFLSAMRAFDVSGFLGIMYIAGACLWSLEALWSFWTLKSVSARLLLRRCRCRCCCGLSQEGG